MTHDIKAYDSEADPTEDELKALEAAEFEIGKGFHDYGNNDLLDALRKGYELGRQDGQMIWEGES